MTKEKHLEQLQQLLPLIAPGPLGKGLTYQEAAKILDIDEATIWRRLQWFKKNMPKEYDNYDSLWRVAKREAESLRWKTGGVGKANPFSNQGISLGSNLYEMDEKLEQLGHQIKDKF